VIVLGVVSALGIFVFNDLHRNKLANVGVGLWETYNTATGLIGDVLSYLRLYALGLAGSMLGLAFNNIGGMILGDGSNALLWIPFLLIVIIGHTLNIAMAALGAFVHPLRLNFLEFFKNSGYEGSGRNFNPLKK
jgi:V/A-type H+-transporting ATPase subunit I